MPIPVRIPAAGVSQSAWEEASLAERALLIAADEADYWKTQEYPIGSNKGPRVDEFLRVARSVPGEPWCAAFVFWCLVKAGSVCKVPYPASVVSWVSWAKARERYQREPARARLGYFDRLSETHIFWISAVQGPDVLTIEGNTNNDGSREGYEVARRVRQIASISGFIDLGGLG
jgi:hypothetical protein